MVIGYQDLELNIQITLLNTVLTPRGPNQIETKQCTAMILSNLLFQVNNQTIYQDTRRVKLVDGFYEYQLTCFRTNEDKFFSLRGLKFMC